MLHRRCLYPHARNDMAYRACDTHHAIIDQSMPQLQQPGFAEDANRAEEGRGAEASGHTTLTPLCSEAAATEEHRARGAATEQCDQRDANCTADALSVRGATTPAGPLIRPGRQLPPRLGPRRDGFDSPYRKPLLGIVPGG